MKKMFGKKIILIIAIKEHLMTTNFTNVVILLLFIIVLSLHGSTQPCTVKNTNVQHAEKLTYKVYYTLAGAYVGAGEANFTTVKMTINKKPVYHIIGEGHSYKSYDWLYRVRDVYETFLDSATLMPTKFIRRVNEGGKKTYNHVQFLHERQQAISTNGIYSIPPCTHDVLSAIYFARNIDFSSYQPGDKIPLDLFLDDSVYHVYIRYIGKEKLKTKHGTFNTIKFKPLLIEGTIFKGGEKMEVWVTDDANKIPILINTPILVGDIRVQIIAAENVAHKISYPFSK
jgi:hypothetical protein